MSLFRSEPVLRCQLILQSEAAYQCVAELGIQNYFFIVFNGVQLVLCSKAANL